MNKEIKDMWVSVLRSGEYKQGTDVLRRRHITEADTYCCLGVLCEIAVKENILPPGSLLGGVYTYGKVPLSAAPPNEVQTWSRLSSSLQNTLIDMNDVDRKSFDEIADYIENWETLNEA